MLAMVAREEVLNWRILPNQLIFGIEMVFRAFCTALQLGVEDLDVSEQVLAIVLELGTKWHSRRHNVT
jgi:hypothetical protein